MHADSHMSRHPYHIKHAAWPQPRDATNTRKLPKAAVAHIDMFNFFREELIAWPAYDSDVRAEIKRNLEALLVDTVPPLSGVHLEVRRTPGAGDWVANGAVPTLARESLLKQ